jgi:hypothetical protein
MSACSITSDGGLAVDSKKKRRRLSRRQILCALFSLLHFHRNAQESEGRFAAVIMEFIAFAVTGTVMPLNQLNI